MAQLRRYLSDSYLFAADYFANKCKEIEIASQQAPTNTDLAENKAYAISAVISSVAFLEAAINEFYLDAKEHGLEGIRADVVALLAEAWTLDIVDRLRILDKYQLALIIARKHRFDKGSQPYQDANALISLRNKLVHSRPEWATLPANFDEEEEAKKIEILLKPRFAENALLKGSALPFFPERCLGFGCADWAVNSSAKFVWDFYLRMGLHQPELRGADVWRFQIKPENP